MFLVLNIPSDYVRRNCISNTAGEIPIAPYLAGPHLLLHLRELLEQFPRRYTLQHLHQLRRRIPGRRSNEYVYVILHHLHGVDPEPIFIRNLLEYLFHVPSHIPLQYVHPILRCPHQVILQIVNCMAALPKFHSSLISPNQLPCKSIYFALRRTAFLPTACCRVSSSPTNNAFLTDFGTLTFLQYLSI